MKVSKRKFLGHLATVGLCYSAWANRGISSEDMLHLTTDSAAPDNARHSDIQGW